MANPVQTKITELAPGFYVSCLNLSVGRVSIRDEIRTVGDPPVEVRAFQAVDIYAWDEEGVRVVCSLVTPSAVDVHGQIITAGRTYSVSRYSVAEPGLGVHHRFHLRFDELTSVEVVPIPFVDRVFNLRAPSEVPASLMFVGNLYDVCGHVQHKVCVHRHQGFADKEFMLLLGSRVKNASGDFMGAVIVHLRGAWVEDVCRKVRKRVKNSSYMPFLLIKHLKLGRPCYSGRLVLYSVGDVTQVVHDCDIPAVIEKRAQLINS